MRDEHTDRTGPAPADGRGEVRYGSGDEAGHGPGEGARRGSGEGARQGSGRVRRRIFSGPLTVEAYLRASNPPRYMQRLRQMESEFTLQKQRLEAAYRSLREDLGHDPRSFAGRWRRKAERWSFDALNELIREHNAWYPAESNLPMDPRTGDFVTVAGASYRRMELGPAWILEHFPASLADGTAPKPPRRVPREPFRRRAGIR